MSKRLEEIRAMTAAMRAKNPEKFDAAAAAVKRNLQDAAKHQVSQQLQKSAGRIH